MDEGSSASVDPVYDETLVDGGAVETDARRIDKGTTSRAAKPDWAGPWEPHC